MENRQSVIRKVTELVNASYGGDWQKAFNAYANAGRIDHTGVMDVLYAAGVGFLISRPAIAEEVMTFLDANADGYLTFDEFNAITHVTPNPPAPPAPKQPGNGRLLDMVKTPSIFSGVTMNEFLTQVESFLNAQVVPDIQAAGSQGTAAIRKLADYFDAQLSGLKFAAPGDEAKCKELIEKCKEAQAFPAHATGPHAPKGFGLPGNPILAALLQILTTVLTQLASQQNPTAPATA